MSLRIYILPIKLQWKLYGAFSPLTENNILKCFERWHQPAKLQILCCPSSFQSHTKHKLNKENIYTAEDGGGFNALGIAFYFKVGSLRMSMDSRNYGDLRLDRITYERNPWGAFLSIVNPQRTLTTLFSSAYFETKCC